MPVLTALLIGCLLVAVTVIVHAAGLILVMRLLPEERNALPAEPWPVCKLLIQVTWVLILVHAIEITIWALSYLWAGCLPDLESAVYFSGASYTTIGYGDLLLPKPWRLFGPIEGLTGILMCGLSTGLFVALVTRIYAQGTDRKAKATSEESPR